MSFIFSAMGVGAIYCIPLYVAYILPSFKLLLEPFSRALLAVLCVCLCAYMRSPK
ncbi:hypothetical protein T492DRAFT_956226 [Pavlovales sp. CCMP2436]|nr:hypothetical protein T492DRAFT_956226 [Pavlovales sp. CCMP2436]